MPSIKICPTRVGRIHSPHLTAQPVWTIPSLARHLRVSEAELARLIVGTGCTADSVGTLRNPRRVYLRGDVRLRGTRGRYGANAGAVTRKLHRVLSIALGVRDIRTPAGADSWIDLVEYARGVAEGLNAKRYDVQAWVEALNRVKVEVAQPTGGAAD